MDEDIHILYVDKDDMTRIQCRRIGSKGVAEEYEPVAEMNSIGTYVQ